MNVRLSLTLTTGLSIALFALAGTPATAAPVLPDPTDAVDLPPQVDCLFGPHIPETFVYYIVWFCATRGAVPEPIGAATGCTFGINGNFPECLQLNCIQVMPWSKLCEGDVEGFLLWFITHDPALLQDVVDL